MVKTFIDGMNLRSIDLNLLTVFDAIMAEGNQSRAANRLGMSQPAMSNALARLHEAARWPSPSDRPWIWCRRGLNAAGATTTSTTDLPRARR